MGHGSGVKAWASQELAVILISCLTNWTKPPAARPSPHCGERWLPLLHFRMVVLRCAGMKPLGWSWGDWGARSGFLGCNILSIRQCKEYFPPQKSSSLSPVSISILSALTSTCSYRTSFTFVQDILHIMTAKTTTSPTLTPSFSFQKENLLWTGPRRQPS